MKKITAFLWVFSLFFLLPGCSNNDDGPVGSGKSLNRQITGSSGNHILSADQYSTLILDIAYVEGFRPSDASISNLVSFLNQRIHKTSIEPILSVVPSPGITEYNLDSDMPDVEDNLRSVYNQGNTMSVFIFFTDGSSINDEGASVTLGAAYYNTSLIIYEKTIKELVSKNASISIVDVETATLQHEFGHLFGLVDLGTPMLTDHLDDANMGHCNVAGCLMSAEIEFGSGITGRFLSGKGVPEIDPLCIADIQAIGGK